MKPHRKGVSIPHVWVLMHLKLVFLPARAIQMGGGIATAPASSHLESLAYPVNRSLAYSVFPLPAARDGSRDFREMIAVEPLLGLCRGPCQAPSKKHVSASGSFQQPRSV